MSIDLSALPEPFKPYQDKILASIKPCVNFTLTAVESLPLWQSKIGGQPYLPLGTSYPQDKDGKALAFLAQFNFAEIPHLPDFPTQGILQFYIASDDLYGLDFDDPQNQDTFRVMYFESVVEDISQLVQTFPIAELDGEDYLPFTGQYSLEFHLEQQPISPCDFAFGAKILDVDNIYDFDEQYQGEDFYEDCIEPYTDLFPETGHRLGGYPFFTQTDPREYDSKIQDYILLFQLDTDDSDGKDIMWGDAGVGNFFIHPDDLRKRDFSKVVYNWDCH